MMPGAMATGSPRAAMAAAAAARASLLNASRAARAEARRSLLDWPAGKADIQHHVSAVIPPPGLAIGEPDDKLERGIQYAAASRFDHGRLWNTGSPAFAGDDGCVCSKQRKKQKCEAAMAVGALDPGVPYESRWAPYDRIHGPGQGQFPEGSIRPRGYMAPDARRSFAAPM